MSENQANGRERGVRKRRTGVVVSDVMDKTVVVRVTRRAPHPLYRKIVRHDKKYMAHDENNEARVGDTVEIIECRPISRHKSWAVRQVLTRAS